MMRPNSPRWFDDARYNRTAGMASRDNVFLLCWTPDNRCNDVMRQVECGGPLDAPDMLPAGGCNNSEARVAGKPLPCVTTVMRHP